MAAVNDITTQLNGMYKTVFGDKHERIIPEHAKIQAALPFSAKGKLGKRFEKPVVIGLEQGITHAAPEAGAFTLDAPLAGKTIPTYVQAFQHVLRSRIAYDASWQAPSNGEQAFDNATALVFQNMVESLRKRLEIDELGYGQAGLGVATVAGNVLTFSAATWSPGVWIGAEGAILEAFDDVDFAGDTQHVLTDGTITSVDLETRQVTLVNATGWVDGDSAYFKSQRTATVRKSMYGLYQIATLSGTLFGVDNTAVGNGLFKGLTVSAGSVDLSVDTILRGQAKMAVRGVDGKLLCWVSPTTFVNLAADLAALVKYDNNAGGRYELGAETIKIVGPTGVVMVEAHAMMKEGDALLWSPKLVMRSGVTDVSFNRAKMIGQIDAQDSYFLDLADAAGFEIRAYSSQYLYTWKPSCVCLINNIINS